MNWIKRFILHWLGLTDHEGRLKDVERHFVTKRDDKGLPVETLADVPLAERRAVTPPQRRGMSVEQRRQWMEQTDGGRKVLQSN